MPFDRNGVVVGAAGEDRLVTKRARAVGGLHAFLKAALGVGLVEAETGEAGVDVAVGALDEGLRGGESAIQKDRADHGFVDITSGGGGTAGLLLGGAEAQMGGQIEFAGESAEEDAVGEGDAQAAEFAFALGWTKVEEGGGDDELDDGVSQELEALVMVAVGGMLVGVAGMGERLLEERGVGEGMAEAGGERRETGGGVSHGVF